MSALQNNDRYVGQLLIRDGIITSEELDRGLQEQKRSKDFLCSTLVRLGFASEEKIFSILSLQIGVPYLNLKDINIDTNVLKRVPGNFALSCKFIPFRLSDDTLYIAMADPLNNRIIEEIKSYIGTDRVKVFLAGEKDIRRALQTYYGV